MPDSSERMSRRNVLRRSGAGLVLAPALAQSVAFLKPAAGQEANREAADDDLAPTPADAAQSGKGNAALPRFNRFPRSVQEYYVHRVREVERAANARRDALKTKEDAERYVADVREKIAKCFGPFPERTPLNAKVTSTQERDGYCIENVIFESRPNFPVTANLYVPTGRKTPMPGVVGVCGHSDSGKAGGSYQGFAQALGRQGYVTLIFDPISQGERFQHVTEKLKPKFGLGTSEHTFVGNRMTLVGENLPTWFAWDGIRALDYLLSRPEVDPKHVGVTGNSGGGTQTTWLCAVEPRFTMAAPSCFVTTLRRNIENEHSSDPEQYPWRLLAQGLDHSDLLAAMAPRPLLILGQEKDYFDARGFEEAAARLKRLYTLLGSAGRFSSFLGKEEHGFSQANREAMYGWFNRQTGVAEGGKEPALKPEKGSALQCTPTGQVASADAATVFTITREQARTYQKSRPTLAGEPLRNAILQALKMPPRDGVCDYRILREARGRSYPKRAFATYVLETEPDVHAVLYRLSDTQLPSRIPRGPKRAVLYVSHESADAELRNEKWIAELLNVPAKPAAFACDVRGVGESQPQISTPASVAKGGSDYFHAGCGLLFDYPTPGQRTFDLLRVLDLLVDTGHEQIHLVAKGHGAIVATFAAVLHDKVTQVTLKNSLTSYNDVAEQEAYRWPLSSLVPGVLKSFDLPDCYRELEKKGLRQIDPAPAAGMPK